MCIGDVSQLVTLLRYNGAAAGGGGGRSLYDESRSSPDRAGWGVQGERYCSNAPPTTTDKHTGINNAHRQPNRKKNN